jgi:SRSO17 transposase
MIIDTRPPSLRPFFAPFRRHLTRPQFHHFWVVTLAWVVNVGRNAVLHLASCAPAHGHRTSLGRFLTVAPWNGTDLLNQQVQRMLKWMKPRRGETIHLIIDDTRIAKRARKMHAVAPIWIPTRGAFTYGHIVVTAAVEFRGVIMPWWFDLWVPKKQAKRSYRKTTQMAAAFIRAFEAPHGVKTRVLFDAFYLTPVVVRACETRGFAWFSVASKNRTLTREGKRPRRRIIDLVPGLLKHQGRNVRMKRARGWACFRLGMVDGRLKGIGQVRMVVRKRPRTPMTTATAVVTNQCSLDARTIAAIYERRWRIEELFKELRSDLGLGDYQVMSRKGILHHLHLCGPVHLMLTHHSMEAVGAQARKVNHEVPLPPLSRRLDAVRRLIRADQIRRLLRDEPNTRRRRKLKSWLLAA